MKRILLLNLPFERPVQRDYGCPHGAKADYFWPPIDLLLFGATVIDVAKVSYLDCLAGKLTWNDSLQKIEKIGPDLIFTIISSVTEKTDLEYLKKVKEVMPMTQICVSGDLVFFSEKEYKEIDVRVRDLTNRGAILELLNTNAEAGVVDAESQALFTCGVFPHELLKGYRYAMPYSLHQGITAVLTNYGCPFHCTFCNSNGLPFKKRDVEEVVQELLYIQKHGIQEVLFRDFTFNLSDVALLCDEIKRNNIRLAWSCWTRADLVNADILRAMKDAGCYLISYGVESGDDDVLARSHKQLDTQIIHEAVKLTKAAGIEVLASVILGFPGEDPGRTQRYVRKLDPDYLAVNLLSLRTGSLDSKESPALVAKKGFDSLISSEKELMRLRAWIEKDFYLRPHKLLRYLMLSLKSRHRIFIFLKNARALFQRWQA